MEKIIIVSTLILVAYLLLMLILSLKFHLDEKKDNKIKKNDIIDQCLKRLKRAHEQDNPYSREDIEKAINLLEVYKSIK